MCLRDECTGSCPFTSAALYKRLVCHSLPSSLFLLTVSFQPVVWHGKRRLLWLDSSLSLTYGQLHALFITIGLTLFFLHGFFFSWQSGTLFVSMTQIQLASQLGGTKRPSSEASCLSCLLGGLLTLHRGQPSHRLCWHFWSSLILGL